MPGEHGDVVAFLRFEASAASVRLKRDSVVGLSSGLLSLGVIDFPAHESNFLEETTVARFSSAYYHVKSINREPVVDSASLRSRARPTTRSSSPSDLSQDGSRRIIRRVAENLARGMWRAESAFLSRARKVSRATPRVALENTLRAAVPRVENPRGKSRVQTSAVTREAGEIAGVSAGWEISE